MSEALAFTGVLAATVAWIALPLIPAMLELFRPRDAVPLDAVGSDSGDLTFFADSFRQFVALGGHASAADGTALPNGRTVARLTDASAPVLDARCGLVVAEPGTTLPPDSECAVEVYGSGNYTIGARSSVRAALSEGTLTLAPLVTTVRWVHGECALTVGDGVQLLGRATSRGPVMLGRGVQFDRIMAPHIVVGEAAVAPSSPSGGSSEINDTRPLFRLARVAAVLASQHWLVNDDLVIPDGHVFRGHLVVRGALAIGADCEIHGSVRADRGVTLGQGAVVKGTVASRHDVRLVEDACVHGPVISEGCVTLGERARVGLPSMPASVSAERIELEDGAEVFGSLSARVSGSTVE